MLVLKNALTVDYSAEMVLKRLSKQSAGGIKNSRALSKFWMFLIIRESWGARQGGSLCFVSGRTEKTACGCQVTYCIYPGPLFWLMCTVLAAFLILAMRSTGQREGELLAIAGVLLCLILRVRYLERAGNRSLIRLLCDNKTYYYI